MRLFVGIKLENYIKEKIYTNFINIPKCYKLTKIDNLHITLFFLGEVDEVFVSEIINKIKFAIAYKSKIRVTLNKTGQFPEKGKAKIIYITGNNGEKELKKMANSIRDNLIEFREKKSNKVKEEEFKFHITIGRLNEKEKFIQYKLPEIDDIIFEIDSISLFKSELTPNGPIYNELWCGYLL